MIEFSGSCLGRYGYVVAITSITDIGPGIIDHDGGLTRFTVNYKAIVFRVFKGEVFDGIVKQVNNVGIFVDFGPIFCFINRHSIPAHFEFHAGIPSYYKSECEDTVITNEETIRVKIIGTRMDMTGLFAVGTLMDDFLGVIHN